jgi:flagellar protein FlbD
MIVATRLDGRELWVNCDQILTVEATPDTVILLHGGIHLMVKERPGDLVERIAAWRRRCLAGPVERKGALVPLPRPTGAED